MLCKSGHPKQHFTLPVLVFRGAAADTAGLPSDDAKTHEEKLELYCESTFLITSEKNTKYLEQFKMAVSLFTCWRSTRAPSARCHRSA